MSCSIAIHRKNNESLCDKCFEFQQQYNKEWRAKNKDKIKGYGKKKKWYKKSPEARRNQHLKFRYGITGEQWEIMFEAQGRSCACCSISETTYKGRWHVEHSHKHNKVRGICCERCNRIIGQLGDEADTVAVNLTTILKYLARSGESVSTELTSEIIKAILNQERVKIEGTYTLGNDMPTKPRHGEQPELGKNGLRGKNAYYTPKPGEH